MWKLVIIIAIVLCTVLIPCAVEAATSVDVVITATGIVIAPPTGFTVSYVSDFETHLSWINPANSMATMIRAAYGHVPTSMTDGYLVYNGAGTSFNDTAVSLTMPDIIYYRAWSQRNDGVWGSLYATTDTEDIMSISYLFIGSIVIIVALIGIGFFSKRKVVLWLAGLASIMLGIYLFSTPTFPMNTVWGMLFMLIALAMAFTPVYFRVPKVVPPPEPTHMQHLTSRIEEVRASRSRFTTGMRRNDGRY
jgi:hypothetical protein